MGKEVAHRPKAEETSENWAKWGDSSNTREGAGGDNQDCVMINWCNPCYNVKVGHNHAEDTNDDPPCDKYDDDADEENIKEWWPEDNNDRNDCDDDGDASEEESFFARSVYHNFLLISDNLVIFRFPLFAAFIRSQVRSMSALVRTYGLAD